MCEMVVKHGVSVWRKGPNKKIGEQVNLGVIAPEAMELTNPSQCTELHCWLGCD